MNRRRRRRLLPAIWLWLASCLLASAGQAHAALQLQPVQATLTPAQAAATRQLLDDAVSRLPPAWAAALANRRITVQWSDDLPAQVHGRALAQRMLLDRALLDGLVNGDQTATSAGEGPITRPALAAVIHELAHFYDRSPQGQLSSDPRLLDLAGWQVRPLWTWLGLRTDNAFVDRSPDRYELSSPVEFVAVNLEYFLLDPAYACRRPALHRYFAEHFGLSPAPADCAPGLVFLQPGADAGQPSLLQVDPERVYAVHYLLARGNDRFMSRWGHSMLRLVICAPGRPRGPDCLLDLQHHRVLSFRAFVDDVQISSWDGLTGSYPSRLFVLPLAQVVEEYTKVQLRDLLSIPLQLERAEIRALLRRATKVHWSYDGRYYFLGNNCAVETFKLLHDGVPRLADDNLASITPTGLLERLQRAGVADVSVLDDADEALRLGYRFASASAHYQAMFDVARRALNLPQTRVQDWLDLPPHRRARWTGRADLDAAVQMRASAALLLLEHAALHRQQMLARNELKQRLFDDCAVGNFETDANHEAGAAAACAALQDTLRLEGLLSHPAALLPDGGYGLPQREERAALERESRRHAARLRQQGERLRDRARQWLSPQRQAALTAIEANIDRLGEQLRRLNQEQGGLQLQ